MGHFAPPPPSLISPTAPSSLQVHQAVKESGKGRVLVVDAGASLQSATLGDILAAIAAKHGRRTHRSTLQRRSAWCEQRAAWLACKLHSLAPALAQAGRVWSSTAASATLTRCPGAEGEAGALPPLLGRLASLAQHRGKRLGPARPRTQASASPRPLPAFSTPLRSVPIGIKALGTNPMKPGKGEPGQRDVTVVVGGVAIAPGDWLYSDEGERAQRSGPSMSLDHACHEFPAPDLGSAQPKACGRPPPLHLVHTAECSETMSAPAHSP